jgi:hypothetical protein
LAQGARWAALTIIQRNQGDPGVQAWDLPKPPNPAAIDVHRYQELLLRTARTMLEPLGVDESTLRDWMQSNAGYFGPPGSLPPRTRKALPLWEEKRTLERIPLSMALTSHIEAGPH